MLFLLGMLLTQDSNAVKTYYLSFDNGCGLSKAEVLNALDRKIIIGGFSTSHTTYVFVDLTDEDRIILKLKLGQVNPLLIDTEQGAYVAQFYRLSIQDFLDEEWRI